MSCNDRCLPNKARILIDRLPKVRWLWEAVDFVGRIGDRRGEGIDLFNMGLALYNLEEKDQAIHLVKQALEIYEAIASPRAEGARKKLKQWGALP
jgi:hypothetical protein